MKRILLPFIAMIAASALWGQSPSDDFVHQSEVTSIAAGDDSFFTADAAGFVIKWSGDEREHYQISNAPIKIIASSKDGSLVASYESNGENVNRVSVWDWEGKERKFARRFNDAVTSLSFAPSNEYIIIGTRYSNSAVFLNSKDGSVLKKIKTAIDSISYASMSQTEQTLFTYSSQGRYSGNGVITYIDMKSGTVKTYNGKPLRFNTEGGLTQATLFHNDLFLAGVKGDAIKIIRADSGKTVASIKAASPVIIKDEEADDLYYIERNTEGSSIMLSQVLGKTNISPPKAIAKVGGSERINIAASNGSFAMFAAGKGKMYLSDYNTVTALENDGYTRVLMSASCRQSVYFLTPSSVIKSSYNNPAIEYIAPNNGKTNMTVWDEGIVLWSKGQALDVVLLDTAKSDMELDSISERKTDVPIKVLFTPNDKITSLHVNDGKVIYVEGERSVKSFDIASMKSKEVYTSLSIQDAILIGSDIYVAKSSGAAPLSPLIKVDTKAGGASPIKVPGDIAFSLSTDGEYIYGASYDSAKEKTTIFSYSIATGINTALISYASEDMSAFVTLDGNLLLTNLGQTSTLVYDTVTRRNITLNRLAALSSCASAISSHVAVVLKDGSVSWYESGLHLCTWHLKAGEWAEY